MVKSTTTRTDASPTPREVVGGEARTLASPSGLEIARIFNEVIQHWHDINPALDWEAAEGRFPMDLTSLQGHIAHLGVINCFQWHLEDECRAHYESPSILALLKHHIDASNQRRTLRIDEIDHYIARELQALRPEPEHARPAVVTPAGLIDHLSILELKRYHAQAIPGIVTLLNEQIDDLCGGIRELMHDLISGQRRLKLYRTVKLYGIG